MECPHCRSSNVQACGKRYSLYPADLVAVFGVAFCMLHQASTPRQFHCDACGSDFARRTAISKVARIILLIFGTIIALYIVFVALAIAHSR